MIVPHVLRVIFYISETINVCARLFRSHYFLRISENTHEKKKFLPALEVYKEPSSDISAAIDSRATVPNKEWLGHLGLQEHLLSKTFERLVTCNGAL